MLGGRPWDPGSVLDRSPAAARFGVRPGQPLGVAHRLVPEATFLEADPAAYAVAFEAVLEALAAFTPAIEGETDPAAPAFGRALLGIEGLGPLWGDEATLTARVRSAVAAQLPPAPRAGIGNTRFGAGVAASMAREATSLLAIPAGGAAEEAAFLAPLPIRLLPAPELEGRFALFGLRRIGDLAALPRSAVVARFGRLGGELHDLAHGLDGRPLRPRRPIERLRAEAELDPPVEQLESLRFVLHHLAGALCEQLAARGAGATCAVLELDLEGPARSSSPGMPPDTGQPTLRIEQVLPEPVAQATLVERLLVARLEITTLTAPVVRLALELDGRAPQAGSQLGLFTPQSATAARLDWQLSSLAIRFGATSLWRVGLGDPEAPLPEARTAWTPAGEGPPATSETPRRTAGDGDPVSGRDGAATRRRTATR
ncbi:MAG: DNA polymerase Y family protein [Candidatus Limnocylindrales bacterium]